MSAFRIFLSRVLLAAAFAMSVGSSAAGDHRAGAIEIVRPHARATAAGQAVGSAYLSLKNGAGADKLLSATTQVASAVELHSMKMDGNVMRMRQIDSITLPAGQTVELKPGGLHMMLMGLKAPLKAGSSFEMTLVFEKAGTSKVRFEVEAPGSSEHRH